MREKSTRDVIRELLVEYVPSVKGEVWEPGAADQKIPKPFLVVREGVSTDRNSHEKQNTAFEVWPYVERASLTDLDNLIKEVLQALNYAIVIVDRIPHYIQYTGTGTEDLIVEDWDAYTKVMNFEVVALDWRIHSDAEPDPINGMVQWTNEHFPEFQTNPREWIPSAEAPAVYWRQAQVLSVDPHNWGSFVNAQLRGHVISPSLEGRKKAVEQIVRELSMSGRAWLSDDSPMLFRSVTSNDGYNPFTDGQISINARYGIMKKKTYIPLRHVYAEDGKARGESHYE